jgi:hypothetical protein
MVAGGQPCAGLLLGDLVIARRSYGLLWQVPAAGHTAVGALTFYFTSAACATGIF